MENVKALGTEYPYREEDFATPEYMERMFANVAVLMVDSVLDDNQPKMGRCITKEEKVKSIENAVHLYLTCVRHTTESNATLLALKHIGSAPNPIEGGQRFSNIIMFGIRYFDDPMYQVMQMPFKELFSDGFEPNVPQRYKKEED